MGWILDIDSLCRFGTQRFPGSMIVSLRDVVKRLWDCEISKAVVLCGEGSSFCSGMDLNLAARLTSLEVTLC